MTKHEGMEQFSTHTEHHRGIDAVQREEILKLLAQELNLPWEEAGTPQEHMPLDPFEQQQAEAKERFARGDVGGVEQWLEKHPHFRRLLQWFALATSLSSAAAAGYLYRSEHYTNPTAMEYVVPNGVWEAKEKMQVVEGLEGVYWTHAPNVPPILDVQRAPQIVEINWTIKEGKHAIAPGEEYQTYWSIEGTVPGPVLRLVQGDVLRIHLTNDKDSAMPHNIDFHSVTGPGGGGEDLLVNPGETKTLEVRMLEPGFYMYHCAPGKEDPAMIPMHMANGMWGYVIVQPRETPGSKVLHDINKPVDHEWYVVQSEWYTTGADKAGQSNLDMERGMERRPSYFVLNGEIGSLLGKNALHAKVGERARIYFGNAGPNFVSNFHVIGTIFDKVYREGDFKTHPAEAVQTTVVPAGGGSAVEFTFHAPGVYKIVSHDLFNLAQQSGNAPMVGAIVVEGEPQPEVYQPIKEALHR